MSSTFRVATFNCENLFARYKFNSKVPSEAGSTGFSINDTHFDFADEDSKKLTAKAIREVDADIICLQEVESLPILDRFASRYLARQKYTHRICVDGNDPRKIDVAFLSRYPITGIKTHRHLKRKGSGIRIFSRDCLVATFDIQGHELTLYANHLKSMMGGRNETKKRRVEQVKALVAILEDDWSPYDYNGNFIVLGDLNDKVDRQSSLIALLKHPHLVNIIDRLPKNERWTHFWNREGEYSQLDYLLVSKALDDAASHPVPGIMRKGLPWRAEDAKGERFDDVGENTPKASDHAPFYVDIPFSALE